MAKSMTSTRRAKDLELCICGHKRADHIYHQGPCRPGSICPARCKVFQRLVPEDPRPKPGNMLTCTCGATTWHQLKGLYCSECGAPAPSPEDSELEEALLKIRDKQYWADESTCMEETYGTAQRAIRGLLGLLDELVRDRHLALPRAKQLLKRIPREDD